jgi:hypothetical protein
VQKAETSLIPDPNPAEKPKLADLVDIKVDESGKFHVKWPLDKKELVITGLAEAIKLVSTYNPPQIIKPQPKFTDFLRGIKR